MNLVLGPFTDTSFYYYHSNLCNFLSNKGVTSVFSPVVFGHTMVTKGSKKWSEINHSDWLELSYSLIPGSSSCHFFFTRDGSNSIIRTRGASLELEYSIFNKIPVVLWEKLDRDGNTTFEQYFDFSEILLQKSSGVHTKNKSVHLVLGDKERCFHLTDFLVSKKDLWPVVSYGVFSCSMSEQFLSWKLYEQKNSELFFHRAISICKQLHVLPDYESNPMHKSLVQAAIANGKDVMVWFPERTGYVSMKLTSILYFY